MERKTKPDQFTSPDSFRDDEAVKTEAPKRRRGPSLFERMTGVGRAARKTELEEKQSPAVQRQEPVRQQQVRVEEPVVAREPEATAAPAAPAMSAPETSVVAPVAKSPDVSETAAKKQSEEDLLDIPAFLRRQAN
jgi:cell division protein FtsZ